MTPVANVYDLMRERLLDPAGLRYTDAKLAPWVKLALSNLLSAMRQWDLPDVTRTFYGIIPAGATQISRTYSGLPNLPLGNLRIRAVSRTLSLSSALPEYNGTGMVLRPFEVPVTAAANPVWQIHKERRVPALNGEWGVQVADDGLSITLPGVLVDVEVEENDETLAGYVSEGLGNWSPVSVDGSLGLYKATYKQTGYAFDTPFTVNMQFAVDAKGLDLADATASHAIIPLDSVETCLASSALAYWATDTSNDEADTYRRESLNDINTWISAAILKNQQETSPLYPVAVPHIQQITGYY